MAWWTSLIVSVIISFTWIRNIEINLKYELLSQFILAHSLKYVLFLISGIILIILIKNINNNQMRFAMNSQNNLNVSEYK